MDPSDIGLFRMAERRMAWIDQRQSLLASNIANANTPGFKARDAASFGASLAEQSLALTRTTANQLPGHDGAAPSKLLRGDGKSPNGNTVSMEDQLARVAETSGNQELVTNLYHKYTSLFQKVLGTNG